MTTVYYALTVVFVVMGAATIARMVQILVVEGGKGLQPMSALLGFGLLAVATKSYRKAKAIAAARALDRSRRRRDDGEEHGST